MKISDSILSAMILGITVSGSLTSCNTSETCSDGNIKKVSSRKKDIPDGTTIIPTGIYQKEGEDKCPACGRG